MKTTSVVDLKKHLSAYLALAEKGQDIEVKKRNVPVAHIVGIPSTRVNRTELGFAKGSVTIKADPTEPFMAEADWTMLRRGDV